MVDQKKPGFFQRLKQNAALIVTETALAGTLFASLFGSGAARVANASANNVNNSTKGNKTNTALVDKRAVMQNPQLLELGEAITISGPNGTGIFVATGNPNNPNPSFEKVYDSNTPKTAQQALQDLATHLKKDNPKNTLQDEVIISGNLGDGNVTPDTTKNLSPNPSAEQSGKGHTSYDMGELIAALNSTGTTLPSGSRLFDTGVTDPSVNGQDLSLQVREVNVAEVVTQASKPNQVVAAAPNTDETVNESGGILAAIVQAERYLESSQQQKNDQQPASTHQTTPPTKFSGNKGQKNYR